MLVESGQGNQMPKGGRTHKPGSCLCLVAFSVEVCSVPLTVLEQAANQLVFGPEIFAFNNLQMLIFPLELR